MPHIDLLITVNRNTCQTFFSLFHFKIWPMCDAYSTKKKKGREQHIHYQKARPQSHKQLSLQYNDLAGTHQIQTRMKDRGKAPPTQLLYVPLHAAEFIKLSMWGEIKAPVLGDFPLLAYCLNMTASVFECCTNAWLRAYSHQASDPVFFPHTDGSSFSFCLFFFTSMLVKRYIQRLKYAFDKDEELIYGHTFIIAHS